MKETQIHQSDQVKKVAEIPVKKQNKLLGSIRMIKGLTLFQFNTKTGELKPAEFQTTRAVFSSVNSGLKRTIVHNPDCIYFQALNISSAKRKLRINE